MLTCEYITFCKTSKATRDRRIYSLLMFYINQGTIKNYYKTRTRCF